MFAQWFKVIGSMQKVASVAIKCLCIYLKLRLKKKDTDKDDKPNKTEGEI